MTKQIRIANGAGFWGDNLDTPRLLAEAGGLDYLTLEYLAELTMSILAHQKNKNSDAGFVTDFPIVLESLIPALKSQPNLKIVTNAGGMNPASCAWVVSKILSTAGLDELSVAVVMGDDLLPTFDEHLAAGGLFTNMETGKPLEAIRNRVVSANAYLGAGGIVEALQLGARIVITGRVADASLVVGPAVHEFGWDWNDWQRLAAASVAGHLIECGAQVTGGMYSDWNETIPLADVGYPVAELSEVGSVVITKPAGTGGAVSVGTVSEQLVYEIGDPTHYLTPDVDVDFTQIQLEQTGDDRIRVSGAQGNPAPESYKVSLAYSDGYMVSGTLVIHGPNAAGKAEECAKIIFERVRRSGYEPARTNVEYLGAGGSLPGIVPQSENAREVVLRISAHDPSQAAVERFSRELVPLVTSGPPGVTGYTGARPKPHPVLAYWPTTIDKSRVSPQVTVQSVKEWTS
jgi:hypothetical protein